MEERDKNERCSSACAFCAIASSGLSLEEIVGLLA